MQVCLCIRYYSCADTVEILFEVMKMKTLREIEKNC